MRLKIFILSTMLITLISGVLFYKNLTQIGPAKNVLRLDFDELRSIDLQIYGTSLYLRKNLNSDLTELQDEATRMKELLEIINEINKNTPELQSSVNKIKAHFQHKQKLVASFEVAIKDLRSNVNALMPTYNELEKKNIKFVVDKRDFYRESVMDAYMYISFSHKENEMRVLEDQKILSQVLSFADAPSPEVQKFSGHIDAIHTRVKEIDGYIKEFKEVVITDEMKIIAKYYQESLEAQSEQNENLLTFMFAAIGIYLVFMIFILRKT